MIVAKTLGITSEQLATVFAQALEPISKRLEALEAKPAAAARRTGKTVSSEPKVTYEIDLGHFMPGKGLPSTKGMAKVRYWASKGELGRLQEYAGLGPTVKPEGGEPRVAVFGPNRVLAANVCGKAFDDQGKPIAKYMTPVTTRKATRAAAVTEAIEATEAPKRVRKGKATERQEEIAKLNQELAEGIGIVK